MRGILGSNWSHSSGFLESWEREIYIIWFQFLNHYLFIICEYVLNTCVTEHMERSGNSLWELAPSFCHVSSGLAASSFTCWAISPALQILPINIISQTAHTILRFPITDEIYLSTIYIHASMHVYIHVYKVQRDYKWLKMLNQSSKGFLKGTEQLIEIETKSLWE